MFIINFRYKRGPYVPSLPLACFSNPVNATQPEKENKSFSYSQFKVVCLNSFIK